MYGIQFTDILIYASAVPPANTTYKVIKRIPLHGMKVVLESHVNERITLSCVPMCHRLGNWMILR